MPDLSVLSKLKEKNLAVQGLMILEGRIVIEKALEAGIVPRFLACTEAEGDYWRARRESVSARPESTDTAGSWFPVHVMPHDELCALVDFKFHRGAIAVADMPRVEPFGADTLVSCETPPDSTDALDPEVQQKARRSSPRRSFLLCLWDVTDPSNLGALVRTAAGLGAAGVLFGPGCASPYYRKTIRASMGNVFSLPLWSVDLRALEALKQRGARIVAATLTGRAVLPRAFTAGETTSHAPLILVLGNEGYGLPEELLALCTDQLYIPMERGVDSLNVAVAGGILMYELLGDPEKPEDP